MSLPRQVVSRRFPKRCLAFRFVNPGFLAWRWWTRALPGVAFALAATVASAADGDPDPTFGTGGLVVLSGISQYSEATAVVPLADGRILVGGRYRNSAGGIAYSFVTRLLADGTVDASFGTAGRFLFSPGGLTELAVDGNGRIVAAGIADLNTWVARLTADGALDGGYGVAGVASFGLGGDRGCRLALHADGRATVAVTRWDFSAPNLVQEVVALRLTAGGALDATFGVGGIATTGIVGVNRNATAIALQPDGAVLVATSRDLGLNSNPHEHYLTRLTGSGAIDPAFHGGVPLQLPFTVGISQASRASLALRDDGRILAATLDGATQSLALVRLLPDGTTDATFGTGGRVVSPGGRHAAEAGLALRPDGRIVVGGVRKSGGGGGVSRFLADGLPDGNFAGAGWVYETSLALMYRVALQPDGKVLVAGRRSLGGQLFEALVLRREGPAPVGVVAGGAVSGVLEGLPVDLTADVFGQAPTGTVSFQVGGVPVAACGAVALSGGRATCPGQVLPAGANPVTVAYSGDAGNAPAVSPAYLQYVLSFTGDADGDGIPDTLEGGEGRDAVRRDNDIFGSTPLFVRQAYRDLLGREGGPSEVAAWTSIANGAGRTAVLAQFLGAPEFVQAVPPAVRLYFATFQRAPDYAGLQQNLAALRSGAQTPVSLAAAFAASPEFAATYGALDDTAFVTLLYNNVLGRAPDAAGLAGWLARLSGGSTRGEVLHGFAQSVEYAAAVGSQAFVSTLYTQLLRRTPDAPGLADWVSRLASGTATSTQVLDAFQGALAYRERFLYPLD